MAFDTIFFIVLIIIFLSSLIRSTFGFGDALIAMPLLVMFIDIKIATPVVALIACIIASVILFYNWGKIDFRRIYTLIIFSIIGIPIGLIYLKDTNDFIIKIILAISIISFSVYKLFDLDKLQLKTDKSSFLFGIIAGILGGAYNTNGPPIIIYGTLRKWESEKFRDMLQGIFLPTNIFIVAGHGIAGLWTKEVFIYFLWSLPVVIIGIILGNKLNKIIPAEKFNKYIHIILIIIGIVLLVNTFTSHLKN
ncbi:MAG: sulfite exporter TauE/SafE family protein [FCB group bacterium]|jgi:uncharacterized membrane protein YfcA